ncbi:MAG: hypothetical protein LDL41_03460 [Coleofasciculus sp. S288]|nr:hypothetical protein [Coleofasciculus sp. S288]
MSRVTSSRSSQPQRNPLGALNLLAIVAATAIAYMAFQYFMIRSNYNKGEQAYETANCEEAIAHFDRVINGQSGADFNDYTARAQAKKAECQAFQDAIGQQKAGKPEAALVAYADFVNRYPGGALVEPIRQQSAALFEQAGLAALAKPTVCEKMDILVKKNLIPQQDTNLPALYHSCGQVYATRENYANAVNMYERFLENYQKHQLASEVKAALAQSMVAEAKAKGAGDILQPGRSGITSDGTTVVEIRNDSPETMRIVFSGPDPRFEELDPCDDCIKYVGKGPESCPNKGPIERYTLKPGQYDVVVKSISDRGIRPFTGNWSLDNGTEYNSCFFIVQQPTAEGEQ